ncbi:SNRNA-ACTIVATING PROTEIN COMPLEX SUBUNIT 4 [Salix viminalis]|uniref:SNRNA-ACTIVATING PROTEIN COMPLEX SUBUNIT 4 n=1 Tax=Salix viminalis TaxID=40686 RepID=A0A9Q0NW88_SALVM|nr:SNRNA-ACTIVATING PROTEIN COMPLEX SUBUNIT 4 [Salix viminalis]
MSRFRPPNDDNEDEEEDDDDDFQNDMEALRQACIVTGTNLTNISPAAAVSDGSGEADGNSCGGASVSDSESEDDFELFRSVQNRFATSAGSLEPLSLKPLCALPPVSDDEEDDFETLCAVKRRFAAYDNNNNQEKEKNEMEKPEVGISDNSLVERNTACEPDAEQDDNATNLLGDNVEIGHAASAEDKELDSGRLSTLELDYSSFPKSAQVFIDAIKKNRSCQKFIRNKLIQIEARIEENNKLKDKVKILKDFQLSCRKITGMALSLRKDPRIQLVSARKTSNSKHPKVNGKKVSPLHDGPVENSHVANYRTALTNFPLALNRKKWTETEKENLGKGIRQQYQEMVLQLSMDQFSCSEGSPEDAKDLDSILVSIRDLEITPEKIREFLPRVNWDQLASSYVAGRSGAECKARWLNFEDLLINQSPWTIKEDKNLLLIVQEKGVTNWFDIAVSLGTNRTPFQCLSRFQRSLNARILKREWTKEEDAQLRAAVETYGERDWQFVASTLEGRAGTQCSNRWKKTLHPAIRRVGRWTLDEDKRLKVAVKLFGPKKWDKIAQFVPGRTQVQCRERWVNCLDPSMNRDEWTEEEDLRLKAAIEECGYCWSKVAERLPQRTDNQCLRRWKALAPHEVPLLQAARRMQKAALISNFVDRESERPALGPNDFVPLAITGPVSEPEKMDQSRKRKRKSRRAESQMEKVVAPGNALKKIRSNRCRKKVQISSKEVAEIPDGTQENSSHAERGQDHPSSNSILTPLMTTDFQGVDSRQNQWHPDSHPEGHKPVDRDGNSKSLLLLPPENSEAGIINGDVFQTFPPNSTTSSKKRRAQKQHSGKNIYAKSGEGSSVLSETTIDASALVNDYLDSNLVTTNEEDSILGKRDAPGKKRVPKMNSESSEWTGSLHSPQPPLENSELRVTSSEIMNNSSSFGIPSNEKRKASKLPCRRKIRIEEPSRKDQCFAAAPLQLDTGKKSKARGKSCSKVLKRKNEDDVLLSSFLTDKSKKKKLEVARNAAQARSSSSMITRAEVLSRVDQPNDGNKLSSVVRNGEGQTCSNGRSSENGLSCDMHAHQSNHTQTKPCELDVNNGGIFAPLEGVREPGSIDREAVLEPGDISPAGSGSGVNTKSHERKGPQLHPKGVEQPRNDTDPDKLSCSVKNSIGSSSKPTIIGNDIEPVGRSSHSPSARGEAFKYYKRRSKR